MKHRRNPVRTGRDGTEAALFDFDMTLVDSSVGITYCLNRLAGFFGLYEVTREEVTSTIGHPMDKAMEMLWGRYEPAWMDHYREYLVPLEYERIMPFPGTREALARLLDEGFSLGVVSNRKKLLRAVESAGLGEYFLSFVGMDDVENPKPHPESIWLSMSNLGSTASGTTLVGDSEIDALAAGRAGIGFVGVSSGGASPDALSSAGALVVIKDISELAWILPGRTGRRLQCGPG
ncbi:MAG TPA: HAD hydrolase-like protein [Synergistales bacterium]|nr:HAD hydrolase-like protein [Synergistales bacterium]HOR53751.1 HAD hydrolase-like protein [Synergistales bacterium]HPK42330.1 HAD hydrolase-like protein [Synergistales bacterium]